MKDLKDFQKMLEKENVILLSNISDIDQKTDEMTDVSEYALYLEPAMSRLHIASNVVTLELLKNEMDDETLDAVAGFYEELSRCVKFNETCPIGHVNVLTIGIMNTDEKDKEGLLLMAPIIWSYDAEENSYKIAFDPECIRIVEGE